MQSHTQKKKKKVLRRKFSEKVKPLNVSNSDRSNIENIYIWEF